LARALHGQTARASMSSELIATAASLASRSTVADRFCRPAFVQAHVMRPDDWDFVSPGLQKHTVISHCDRSPLHSTEPLRAATKSNALFQQYR